MIVVDTIESRAAEAGIRIAQPFLQFTESFIHAQGLGGSRANFVAGMTDILEHHLERQPFHILRAILQAYWQLPERNLDFIVLAISAARRMIVLDFFQFNGNVLLYAPSTGIVSVTCLGALSLALSAGSRGSARVSTAGTDH